MTPTAVILYGPPASGKDTITTALSRIDQRYKPFRRLKIGAGRTEGYRPGTPDELESLRSHGLVLYENERYGNTYVVDEPQLAEMLQAGQIPVLHIGQIAGVRALTDYPARWIPVLLWCSRETTEARAKARGSVDIAVRLAAWDETLNDRQHAEPSDFIGIIDTDTVSPEQAAATIHSWVVTNRPTQPGQEHNDIWTAAFDIVVPALALRQANGDIDVAATRRYAERAAATWVDYFIISGSTTRGQDFTPDQRADLLDLWLDVTDRRRLLACCWTTDDIKQAAARDIAPMVTMRQLDGHVNALEFLRQLPKGAYIYSHPMFGGTVFDAQLASAARDADALPAGGKIAKISAADVAAISIAVGPAFKLWDGSSRRIQASLDAGAAGVVATPFCGFETVLPTKEPAFVQAAVDPVQAALDALPDRASRTGELLRWAATP